MGVSAVQVVVSEDVRLSEIRSSDVRRILSFCTFTDFRVSTGPRFHEIKEGLKMLRGLRLSGECMGGFHCCCKLGVNLILYYSILRKTVV